jgi:hypothetical protein
MATLVGTQTDFSQAIKELLELDYDAVDAYKAAIERLNNLEYITMLTSFMNDHQLTFTID